MQGALLTFVNSADFSVVSHEFSGLNGDGIEHASALATATPRGWQIERTKPAC
jgi:hypothetical protein